MKFAVAALLGYVSAVTVKNVESPDCPSSQEVFSYNERVGTASGFLQLSACSTSGVSGAGITCIPDNQYFATGMNGDEDLGEDIIMKGKSFHYDQKKGSLAQWSPVVVETTGALPACHGNNGPDGVNCAKETCSGTNGPMDGETGTPCKKEEPDSVPHYNTDTQAGRPYQTSGDITKTSPEATSSNSCPASQTFVQLNEVPVEDEAEKVSVLQTPYGHTHTSFY